MRLPVFQFSLAAAGLMGLATASAQTITVSFPASISDKAARRPPAASTLKRPSAEPRMQIDDTLKSQMVFGVTSRRLEARRAYHYRRRRTRLSAREPQGRAARRLYRPGRTERLRDLSPLGRQDCEAGARPRRRTALEPRAGQSAVEAPTGPHRPRSAADHRLARSRRSRRSNPSRIRSTFATSASSRRF
jgi:hypothetical protein